MKLYIYESYNPNQTSSERLARLLALKNGWGNFSYAPEGRPLVDRGHVSISHSQHYWALSYDAVEHGLDIEVLRPLKQTLIDRFKLNVNDPLFDWCSREAYFKICQREQVLFEPIPSSHVAHRIDHSQLCIALVVPSKHDNRLQIQTLQIDESL